MAATALSPLQPAVVHSRCGALKQRELGLPTAPPAACIAAAASVRPAREKLDASSQ
jgi:hypothetical protein